MALNTYTDVSAIAQNIQELAIHVVREEAIMLRMVQTFNDAQGANPRVGYKYNQAVASTIAETDDLTGDAFTPAADQTLTPGEIGLQFFLTDKRRDSELPENFIRDGSLELGYAATDRIQTDLVTDIASLTGGTIGQAGTIISWGLVSAAIAVARGVNKSASKPLSCVIHGYQAQVLGKTASVAGATSIAQAPQFTDLVTRQGMQQAFVFMGVPIFQVFASPDTSDDFTGGVFPREAIAMDWRRRIRIEPERDASRRGTEFNMSSLYAHGVWRPARGVKLIADASVPTQ
jgi:hypothetical protein